MPNQTSVIAATAASKKSVPSSAATVKQTVNNPVPINSKITQNYLHKRRGSNVSAEQSFKKLEKHYNSITQNILSNQKVPAESPQVAAAKRQKQ